jgi:5-methyltetrahydrofolate--homocysteine methyltransferase
LLFVPLSHYPHPTERDLLRAVSRRPTEKFVSSLRKSAQFGSTRQWLEGEILIIDETTRCVMSILDQITISLEKGDSERVSELTQQAIGQDLSAKAILDNGLIAGMDIVGEKFKNREMFLPEVLLSAKAMYAGMDLLRPLFLKEGIQSSGKVVIGTVRGDVHDIGKNLVGIMLRGAGYEVIDLGKDVKPERFVEVAQKEKAVAIGMSALLTTTMPVMKEVIELLDNKGLKDSIKIIVGGAPVSQDYADHIGADAYGYDAANAVICVKRLVSV